MQTTGKAAVDAVRDPCERKNLSAVRVAGELEAEAGLFHDRQARGRMVQQNARKSVADVDPQSACLSSAAFMCSGEDES